MVLPKEVAGKTVSSVKEIPNSAGSPLLQIYFTDGSMTEIALPREVEDLPVATEHFADGTKEVSQVTGFDPTQMELPTDLPTVWAVNEAIEKTLAQRDAEWRAAIFHDANTMVAQHFGTPEKYKTYNIVHNNMDRECMVYWDNKIKKLKAKVKELKAKLRRKKRPYCN